MGSGDEIWSERVIAKLDADQKVDDYDSTMKALKSTDLPFEITFSQSKPEEPQSQNLVIEFTEKPLGFGLDKQKKESCHMGLLLSLN